MKEQKERKKKKNNTTQQPNEEKNDNLKQVLINKCSLRNTPEKSKNYKLLCK